MRYEPIEIAMMDRGQKLSNARRRHRAMTAAMRIDGPQLASDVVDEAFADPQTARETPAAGNRHILGELAAQVVSIDRQCQQLSRLIKSLDAKTSPRR